MNADHPFQHPTHRGATYDSLPRALAWFFASAGLALAAACFSPAAGDYGAWAVDPMSLAPSL